jgi:pimeloyl-ACP methyl ester carboxylesterase
MPRLRVNQVELHYDLQGPEDAEAAPLVFAHGLLWDHRMWTGQIEHFRGRYRCLSFDHRGQGLSSGAGPACDLDTLCEDTAALIRALGLPPVHFVGLSMGGFVGLRLAARHPTLLRSLSLLDSSADAEPAEKLRRYRHLLWALMLVGARPLVSRLLPLMFGRSTLADPTRAGQLQQWRAEVAALPRKVRHAVRGVIERDSMLAELPRIRCPTLVLVGEEDITTPPEASERMAERIPDARLIRLPRVGHMCNLEAPRQVNAILDAFWSTVQD